MRRIMVLFVTAALILGVTTNPVLAQTGDEDSDGVPNAADNCPLAANPDQTDTDQDTVGDACDLDDDGDGVADTVDNCRLVFNPDQTDTDLDAVGDACESTPAPSPGHSGFGNAQSACGQNLGAQQGSRENCSTAAQQNPSGGRP